MVNFKNIQNSQKVKAIYKSIIPQDSFIHPYPNGTQLDEPALQWAESVGISRDRAKWLASCPAGTKCGYEHIKFHREIKPDAFLYKSDRGRVYYLRIRRAGKTHMIRLAETKEESLKLRDQKMQELGFEMKYL